jgi:energy-coupling factor transport system ATP-binding protein
MIAITDTTVEYQTPSGTLKALDSVSLEIDRGEYVALYGPNGSGKSTLLKVICGLVPASGGKIAMLDRDVMPASFSRQFFGKVGVVFQNPETQFIMSDVPREIRCLIQNLGLPHDEQVARFDSVIREFHLIDLLAQHPEDLSGGQMQIVNLACAMASKPEILLLDEPTTFLDQSWRERFLDTLENLHKNGVAILHITQYPDEIIRAPRVCVLEKGKLIYDGAPRELFGNHDLAEKLRIPPPFAFQLDSAFGIKPIDRGTTGLSTRKTPSDHTGKTQAAEMREPIIDIPNLSFSRKSGQFRLDLKDIKLHAHEVVGLVGPAGAGKSTLAFLLAGLLKPSTGKIFVENHPLHEFNAAQVRNMIALSWQIADLAAIGPTVADDIAFGQDSATVDKNEVSQVICQVGLQGFENRIIDTLSGGEMRKLSLATILIRKPRYLILDEPSAFLDPPSQSELLSIIENLKQERYGIMVIGHDLYFISEVADRIVGLKDGKLLFDLASTEFFSDTSYLLALGLPPNRMVHFRQRLKNRGIDFPNGTLNPQKIQAHLKSVSAI